MRNHSPLARKILFAIVVAFFSPTVLLYAQRDALSFERISVEDGLSQNTVYDILQDHMGFLWFGTEDGLNRFDGVNFKKYTHRVNDSLSLSNNRVISIIEDSKHRLWVGTIGGGLNLFERETGTFVSFKHNPDDNQSLSNNKVMTLLEDPSGMIWVGTADGGLNLFDPKTGHFKRYINTLETPNLLPSNVIRSLHLDTTGKLWIGTNKGLAVYNPTDETIADFKVYDSSGVEYPVGIIRRIFEDSLGKIWIATDDEGAVVYNPVENSFVLFGQNSKSQILLPCNTVHDFYEDDDGAIWIATYRGLVRYNPESSSSITYQNNLFNSQSLSSDQLRRLYMDSMGILWIGTDNNGINKFDTNAKRFVVYRSYPGGLLDISSTTISSIVEDNDGVIWIGTYNQGLIRFDVETESFEYISSNGSNANSLPSNFITSLALGPDNNLWVGTNKGLVKFNVATGNVHPVNFKLKQGDISQSLRVRDILFDSQDELWIATQDNGVIQFSPSEQSFENFRASINDSKSISQNRINSVFEDRAGNIWIATSHEGLNLFDKTSGETKKVFRKGTKEPKTIASDRIISFYQDTKGRLWLGTAEGLSLFSYADSTFTNFTALDGLSNDVVYAIEEDANGRLWISTNKGLSCLDYSNPLEPRFRNYDKFDGLPVNEFSSNASYTLKSGEMLFGGLNSFIVFNPLEINDDATLPWVYIYEARVAEQSFEDHKDTGDVVVNLLQKDSLEFSYSQNNISFYVTVIHPRAPQKNRYKYMLEGFDNKWIEPASFQQFVRYTNLKPGEYNFKVRACNSDGLWSDMGDEFHFTITKPFWNKWWFYLLISFIFSAIVYLLARLREARLVQSKELLEEMVNERTKEIQMQSERLHQANEEIRATSEALSEQNELLTAKNEEITIKNNELEEQKNSLANLAWELQDKNEEITAQRNEIERQKKEITDSIFYAQRIQQAVLPTQDQIKELFPEFFIFNRPKSIVSGDFYWATRIGRYRIVAVVDCTGHGVPGGFMSMLGVLMLNEVISLRGYTDPAKALNQLRQGIISVLHQKGEFSDAADGMDLSLCVIDDENKTLTYSGANSSMVIFEPLASTDKQVSVIRSDRMPIAYHPLMKSFSNKVVPISNETVILLYSDGIVDQFGGPSNKKFQHHRLLEFIVENSELPVETQGIVLEQIFDKWKGKTYQVDDVLVMGLRL
jgi:ligand-binding sensor domain-containing protein/serine phosphatase RsbU (regulator of sigma subunit)